MSALSKPKSQLNEHIHIWTVVLVWLAVAFMAAVVAHVVAAEMIAG